MIRSNVKVSDRRADLNSLNQRLERDTKRESKVEIEGRAHLENGIESSTSTEGVVSNESKRCKSTPLTGESGEIERSLTLRSCIRGNLDSRSDVEPFKWVSSPSVSCAGILTTLASVSEVDEN